MPCRTPRLVITFLLTLRIGKEKNTPILRFACIFSNAAYMGFPLIQALFGAEGLLYASAYVTVFNILLWTVGYAMVSGKVRPGEVLHSILTTPVLWSVLLGLTLYLFRVNVPELIRQPLQLVGNMNTPLSMIITGMLIAGSKPEKLLGNREIYRIILIRMLFIPLVSFLLFRLLSVQGMGAEGRPRARPLRRHHLGVCRSVWLWRGPRSRFCRYNDLYQYCGAAALRYGSDNDDVISVKAYELTHSSWFAKFA